MKRLRYGCRFAGLVVALGVVWWTPASSWAAKIRITVGADETVRDIAQRYLKDANLWPEILRSSSLQSASDLHPGMQLEFDADTILGAVKAVEQANAAIEEATRNGARLFAVAQINGAIAAHEEAMTARKAGQWEVAKARAGKAQAAAKEALSISKKKQDSKGDALIQDGRGGVEKRGSTAPTWQRAKVGDELAEGDKVRTLADSSAEISFRDGGRIRLNENSQALIQSLRVNLLEKKSASSVSIIAGDVLALLSGNKTRQSFDLTVAESNAQVKVKSSRFWVGKEKGAAKFANYDGEIELSSSGKTVVLKENQGAIIKDQGGISSLTTLLPAPLAAGPDDDSTIYTQQVVLEWKAVKDAASYWLEIGSDRTFKRVFVNDKNIKKTSFDFQIPELGVYYWRVAAFDKTGFPGAKNSVRYFKVIRDNDPPFLAVVSPRRDEEVSLAEITLKGEVEPGAKLTIGGQEVKPQPDGNFTWPLTLQPGKNVVSLRAVDRAGNGVDLEHVFHFVEQRQRRLEFANKLPRVAERHFLTPVMGLTLEGVTAPRGRVEGISVEGAYRGSVVADGRGSFALNLRLQRDRETFAIKATAGGGEAIEEKIIVEVDAQAPRIVLDGPLVRATRNATLLVSGKVGSGATLFEINGKAVALTENGFSYPWDLQPGLNKCSFYAVDAVGNEHRLEYAVVRDVEPPEIKERKISLQEAVGGEYVEVTVAVKDQTEIRKAARFVLRAGASDYVGYLERSTGAEGVYQGGLRLPLHAKGKVTLRTVELSDYLGNVKTTRF